MLMRGHRSMERLSYFSERLDTDTRGGREVTEEGFVVREDEWTHTYNRSTYKRTGKEKRLCSDGNISKDDNSDGNCRFTLIMK
jgi:hypothetical protein